MAKALATTLCVLATLAHTSGATASDETCATDTEHAIDSAALLQAGGSMYRQASVSSDALQSKQAKWRPEKETVELSNGNRLEIAFKPGSPGQARCAVFCFFTRVKDTLIEELSKRPGEDWVVANGPGANSKSIENFVKLVRRPANAEKLRINPNCIALLGYSMGGIRAGAATKVLGREAVKGMIYLNSGNRNFRGATSPYADYLFITGMDQKDRWVNGNADLIQEMRRAGGVWYRQEKLEGVGHTNWRKEKTRVFNAFCQFLINRVRKPNE